MLYNIEDDARICISTGAKISIKINKKINTGTKKYRHSGKLLPVLFVYNQKFIIYKKSS